MIGPVARNSEARGRLEEGFSDVCAEVSAAETVGGGDAGEVVHATLAAIPSEISPTEKIFLIKQRSPLCGSLWFQPGLSITDNPRGLTIRTSPRASTKSTSPGGGTGPRRRHASRSRFFPVPAFLRARRHPHSQRLSARRIPAPFP